MMLTNAEVCQFKTGLNSCRVYCMSINWYFFGHLITKFSNIVKGLLDKHFIFTFIIYKTLICFISEEGASKAPCSDQYCGPSPFSESEVKSVADFISMHKCTIKAFIDFHSYSQLWMTPWGYTKDLPADYTDQASSLLCIYVYSLHCYHYASFQTYFRCKDLPFSYCIKNRLKIPKG